MSGESFVAGTKEFFATEIAEDFTIGQAAVIGGIGLLSVFLIKKLFDSI